MKNSFTIYHKQYADYFDYLEIAGFLPEIKINQFGLSQEEYSMPFYEPKNHAEFILSMPNKISYLSSERERNFSIRLLGFGISINRVFSY